MATRAEPGMVMTQVMAMSLAFFQRTAFGRSEAPMPMIEVATTCVVDTGAPITDAVRMTSRRGQLRTQRVNRPNAVNREAQRANDPPAAREDAQGNRRGAGQHHPERNFKGRDETAQEQRQRQHAHALLRVVGTVREGQPGGVTNCA
jgi:hypothetical protein